MRPYIPIIEIGHKKPPMIPIPQQELDKVLEEASEALLSLQHQEGYWWFTLEANESIGAGFIQLQHFLGDVDLQIQKGLVARILQEQHEDGTWGLYYGAPGDLSITVECYFSLRLAGFSKDDPALIKARAFILSQGGLTKIRIFTRIHLALFGIIRWGECPAMPPEMMLLPPWAPMNIYHFSSWARASIVPLLVVLNKKPKVKSPIDLEELYVEPANARKFKNSRHTSPLSLERLFLLADKGMKYMGKIPIKNPWRGLALEKAIEWVWEHIQKTEDIYPALAYGAMSFKAYGYKNDSPEIQAALNALKSFQQVQKDTIHQQCCISPVWDTPWGVMALLEAGKISPSDPKMIKAGEWLLSKEVRNPKGDWHFQNPKGEPSGWSFEFKNEYFPDVDDTIEVLHALKNLKMPAFKKEAAIQRGLNWIISMQNDDGGFGAFDKNNDLELVNKIPFADHEACLDPSTPDITARAIELFMKFGWGHKDPLIQKALHYLKKSQEKFGGWYGRWGVNYIYGTWTVLTAMETFGAQNPLPKESQRALHWLESIQNEDGGFSESPSSYVTKRFSPYPESVPSQTAWALMGLIAGGKANSASVQRGIQFLLSGAQEGLWQEPHHTGTGFPGHFYLRYHGYRYYFPLLALARYKKATLTIP